MNGATLAEDIIEEEISLVNEGLQNGRVDEQQL